jgi:hypothetical protein
LRTEYEYYDKKELISALKMGMIPADKNWGEGKNFIYPDKPFDELTADGRAKYYKDPKHTGLEYEDTDKVAFNLHLDDDNWN